MSESITRMAPIATGRWQAELKAAQTDKDVLNVARDFLAMLAKDEIATLPTGCAPRRLDTCKDIAEEAVRLLQESLAHTGGESEGVKLLREIAEFFAAASSRITELHSPPKNRYL